MQQEGGGETAKKQRKIVRAFRENKKENVEQGVAQGHINQENKEEVTLKVDISTAAHHVPSETVNIAKVDSQTAEQPSSTSNAALDPHAALAVDIFEIPYDKYTAQDLYALLKSYTRQEVEKRMVEREQLRHKQQEGPRVQRFLDVVDTARVGNSSGGGGDNNNNNNNSSSNSGAGGESIGYEYSVMLQRLFAALNRNKESSAITERNQVPEPQLERVGKKKVIITNFFRICQAINRPVEDVKDFIEKELSVRGNLDSNNALILKYEIQRVTAFDNIITRYLDEFVKCNSCRRIDTTLTKEDRRMELRCNWCTATRTVQAVGSATYSAQVGKRSKARQQALTL